MILPVPASPKDHPKGQSPTLALVNVIQAPSLDVAADRVTPQDRRLAPGRVDDVSEIDQHFTDGNLCRIQDTGRRRREGLPNGARGSSAIERL